MKGLNIGVCAVATGLLMAATSVSAAPVTRDYTIGATGNCNGSLPSYEGNLRKRPLAINNEGSSIAFVSCSLPGDFFNEGNSFIAAAFENVSAASVTVNCTLVDGFPDAFGGAEYYTREVVVPANGAGVAIWEPADEGVATFSTNANLNCSLPAGAGINFIEIQFDEDNGVADPV